MAVFFQVYLGRPISSHPRFHLFQKTSLEISKYDATFHAKVFYRSVGNLVLTQFAWKAAIKMMKVIKVRFFHSKLIAR